MEFKDIKQLASLMKETGLTALEYAEGDTKIRMERGTTVQTASAVAEPQQPAVIPAPTATAAHAVPAAEAGGDTVTVVSPMVGVFYAAPGADKRPYVSIGDHVSAGDVLCIIEAMKMMNEITADSGGTIAEICVGNKQIVEFGHPLFRIRPD